MDLIQMSIQGGLLIILIITVRSVWLNSLPKTAFIVMWKAAILRLLLPIKLPFDLSAPKKLPETLPAVTFTDGGAIISQSSEMIHLSPITQPQTTQNVLTVSIPAMIWLTGMTALSLYFAITYIRCRRGFSAALPAKNEFVSRWLDSHKLRRAVTVRESDAISSPMTYGIINPVILLPKNIDTNNKQQLRIILMHEFVHIRRFDGVLKFFSTLSVCIHWFNPLVWIMHELVARDIELRCDESVLKELGIDSRADYALTLIDLEEQRSGLQPIGSGFAKSAVEERIVAIMKYKNRRATAISIVLALIFALIIATLSVFGAFFEVYPQGAMDDIDLDKPLVVYVERGEPLSGYTRLQVDETGNGNITLSEVSGMVFANGNVAHIFNDDGNKFTLHKGDIVTINLVEDLSAEYSDKGGEIIDIGYITKDGKKRILGTFRSGDFDNGAVEVTYRVGLDGDYEFYLESWNVHSGWTHIESFTIGICEATADKPSPESSEYEEKPALPVTILSSGDLPADGSLVSVLNIYKDHSICDGIYNERFAIHFKKGEHAAVVVDLGSLSNPEDSELCNNVFSGVTFKDVNESYLLTEKKILWSPQGAPEGKTYLVSIFTALNDGNYTFFNINKGAEDVSIAGQWIQLQNYDDDYNVITCRLRDEEGARIVIIGHEATSIEPYSFDS